MLQGADVLRLITLGTLGHGKLDGLSLRQSLESGTLNRSVVHKNIPTGRAGDKSITLCVVKPFHLTLFSVHVLFLCCLDSLAPVLVAFSATKKSCGFQDPAAP